MERKGTEKELGRVRWHLKEIRDTIRRRLEESETESVQALSSYDNHPADLGTDTFSRELDTGLATILNRRLDEVERAEQKIREGTYGFCDRCGRAIERDRLTVKVEAIFCRDCQETVDLSYHTIQEGPSEAARLGGDGFGTRDSERGPSVNQEASLNTPQDAVAGMNYEEPHDTSEEPAGYVEEEEAIVDEQGEVLFDTLRDRFPRIGQNVDAESDEYPD